MAPALRSLAALACVAAALGSGRTAAADESVDEMFRRGVELRRTHQNAEALTVFEEIVARAPTPAARAQLALAEHALGRWLAAERDLDAALASGDDAWIAKNVDALRAARTVIEGHLAWVTVTVDVPGATIEVSGAPLASGVEARVVAGDAVLDARAAAHLPSHRVVPILPGEHAVVVITLDPLPSPPPPIDRTEPARTVSHVTPKPAATSIPVGPIVVGALGVGALATGTYFGVRTIGFKSERDGACTNGCMPAAANYDSDARSSATASTIAFGVGAGFLITGVVWWLVGGNRPLTPSPLEVAPVVGGGERGLFVRLHL